MSDTFTAGMSDTCNVVLRLMILSCLHNINSVGNKVGLTLTLFRVLLARFFLSN